MEHSVSALSLKRLSSSKHVHGSSSLRANLKPTFTRPPLRLFLPSRLLFHLCQGRSFVSLPPSIHPTLSSCPAEVSILASIFVSSLNHLELFLYHPPVCSFEPLCPSLTTVLLPFRSTMTRHFPPAANDVRHVVPQTPGGGGMHQRCDGDAALRRASG